MTEPSLKDDLNCVLDAVEELTSEAPGNPDRDKLGYNLALRFHVFALQRDLQRLQDHLITARESGQPDGVVVLEEAFWRVDAACEKIMAILCLALGVHAVVVRDGRLFFRPNEDPARSNAIAELRKRAVASQEVRRLAEVYQQLVVAIRYRNQVSHGLSSIDSTFRAPFVAVYLDADLSVRRIEPSHLVPEGALDGNDASAAALFTRALEVAGQASDLLRDALPALAATIRTGVIRPGPFVFYLEREGGTLEVFAVSPTSSDSASGDR